jgi:hypothetical protein
MWHGWFAMCCHGNTMVLAMYLQQQQHPRDTNVSK